MKKFIFTLLLAIVSSVWMMSEASEWCMSVAQSGSGQNIRIGGTFQAESMPCEADTLECPPCLTIALKSGGMHYLVSGDPHIVAILDTVAIGSFTIIEGNHYLEGHFDFINVTNIIFPETDIPQLAGEWEISRETVSTPTGDGGTRWFSTHDVNYTNYVLADDLIYKVILDQVSGYAHYSDAVPYTLERKEDGTWLLTAEGLFSSSDPVEEGIPSPVTIYRLTEDEMEWMYAANGGDEGPNYYYQHFKRHKQKEDKLPSLCDEWNIAKISGATGPYEEIHTVKAALSTDTIIGTQKYVKLFEAGLYKGALREGENSDIYYIPNGSAHEYLLYNFNANVGDTLSNLWYGGSAEQCPNGYNATVLSISEETPRVFTVEVEYIISDSEGDHIDPWVVFWTEGVGMSDGPAGQICPGPDCACSCGQVVLCAYKNGEHIYTSDLGKKYGCEYNYNPYVDTIPLFVKDGPGTSTIDPVDPNLIYALLQGEILTIRDFSGAEIYCTLVNTTAPSDSPHRVRLQAQPFRDSLSVEITDAGQYDLVLTSTGWDYTIFGSFTYGILQGIETPLDEQRAATKMLRDGQLILMYKGKMYNVQGQQIQ